MEKPLNVSIEHHLLDHFHFVDSEAEVDENIGIDTDNEAEREASSYSQMVPRDQTLAIDDVDEANADDADFNEQHKYASMNEDQQVKTIQKPK